MGRAEDDEPPPKRVKVSSRKLGDLSKSTLLTDPASCSLNDLMAHPLVCQGDDEVVGAKGVVKKVEFVRIIAEALYSLGYNKAGARLEEESGIPLQSTVVKLFMQQILDGKWDESVATLHIIGLMDEKIVKLASFEILEQKFFELLDGKKVMDALKTLRTELGPLCINNDRVRDLSLCILSPSQKVLAGMSGQDVVRPKSRTKLLEELQKLLPPTVIIREQRLIHLVEQALDLQLDACRFHNSSVGEMSLLTDHQCGRDQIPSRTLQILQDHSDEVWFLQFSHDGKYLASSAADCLVIIWEVKLDGLFCVKHRFSGHQKPVSYISWSPDDHQLLTCGVEEVVRRWDVESGECIHIYEKNGLGLISCGWAPDGNRILCGVTDKSISMWDLEGKELECWKGHQTIRISDLGITSDGKHVVSVCKDNMILLFGWESKAEKVIQEDQTITSFVLSTDNKYLLVSLWNQEIHLWDIEGTAKLISKYNGHKRSRFVIRSCFGGLNQAFIASGSEDSQVYMWHISSGELVETLAGHSGTVNCVSWNPVDPHMLASASDDHTIRIWGLNQVKMKHTDTVSNGVHYCNGGT
ncbi:WD repeat-containing protein 26 homolog isoform X1 [Solanum stenotomum]|uniref:WD repeat-containing protein 26 homolog isoform X1 n=1 Tax=Solanum stenotomum TaxID=172797 RepID=UPI0020D1E163|nr:WD repeat-containing protein 26 homolog isoform X1 [Solanum stenotomum]